MNKAQIFFAGLLALVCGHLHAAEKSWTDLRQAALNRPRRIIFNNDGNEPVYFCKTVSKAELLRSRTAPLIGSQVDSIFYCTWSSGFGMFTHNTKVGHVFNTREALFSNNLAQPFLDQGIDPLTTMIEFGHSNRMEIFWSMRMNDTHDGSHTAYGPVMFRANPLKLAHPEYLIGQSNQRQKYGAWSAVDYGVDAVRDLAFRYVEEVCQNYEVDGIELDFFRHAFLFKCSAEGKPCGDRERKQLNDLIDRIRAMTERVGRKRRRPILLAVRVPDSVPYCKTIGIDLEHWLRKGWIDLLITGGYTRLNPWEYSVELGHKYGVKVYPSLDEPRVRDQAANKLRATAAAYRGRALNAWTAGMDGIYMFNFFDPHSSLWRELGDANILRQLPREYFVSIRGSGSMPIPHQNFLTIPVLNPSQPITLTNQVTSIPLRTGELATSVSESVSSSTKANPARLILDFKSLPAASDLQCNWNAHSLPKPERKGETLTFEVPPHLIQRGENVLQLRNLNNSPAKLLDARLVISR